MTSSSKRNSLSTIKEEENISDIIQDALKTPKRKSKEQTPTKRETPTSVSSGGTRQRTPRHCAEQAREKINSHFNKSDRLCYAIPEDESEDSERGWSPQFEDESMPRGEYGADKEDEDLAGRGAEIFGFKTPKRKMSTPMKTPLKTPTSVTKQHLNRTPDSRARPATCLQTPQTVRRCIRKKLVQVTAQVLDGTSDPESLTESESSSDDENNEGPQILNKTSKIVQNDINVNAEDYFLAQSSAVHTSDRTLNRLKTPRLNHDTVDALLESVHDCHAKEKQKLFKESCKQFLLWSFLLREGYNILVHGLGSKRLLLDEFRITHLGHHDVLVINGFFPGLTIKEILNSIIEGILEGGATFSGGPTEQMDLIEEHFESNSLELYIVIHNIDGPSLQFKREQEIICRLASISGVHVIASIDHVNSPLLWDQQKLGQCRFVHFDCTTFAPYTEEISYENSLLVHQTSTLGLASLVHVFASLTFNAKAIYIVIAKRQLANKKNENDATYYGYPFHELYNACRDKMLVNSDLTLRAQLTEFKDHKLLRVKRSPDGTEVLDIPIENSLLEEFIQKYEE